MSKTAVPAHTSVRRFTNTRHPTHRLQNALGDSIRTTISPDDFSSILLTMEKAILRSPESPSAVGHLPRTSVACLTLSSHYRLFARLFTPSRRTHPQETHRLSQLCQVKQPHSEHKCLGSLQSLGIQILLRVRQVCCLRDTHSLTGRKDDRGRSPHHTVYDAYDGPQGQRRVSDTCKCPTDADRQRDQRRRNLAPRPHASDPPESPTCMQHTHTC